MTEFETIGVIGAGTMGSGISQLAAQSDFAVIMRDIEESIVGQGMEKIKSNLDRAVEKEIFTEDVAEKIYSRIEGVVDLEKVTKEADVIIECVPEDLGLKKDLFEELDDSTDKEVILATNTSSISVAQIALKTKNPERVLGLHFFNPPYIMKLLEVIVTQNTSEEMLEKAVEFAGELGRDPVVINDSPGFVSSRISMALGFEAARVVQEGVAPPEAVDEIMEKGYNHQMGPLKTGDLVGWDVRFHIGEYLYKEFGNLHLKPPPVIRKMVRAGELGKKTGKGFYDWSKEENPNS